MSLPMNKSNRRRKTDILVTLVLSTGFGLYADLFFQSASFTMENHAFRFPPFHFFFLLTGIGFLVFSVLSIIFTRFKIRRRSSGR